MKNTLKKSILAFIFLLSITVSAQNTISTDELKTLLGEWTGSLTYVDYGTNKPFSMPANLVVSQGKSEYQLVLNVNYPKEPNANSKDKIKISKDGTELNKLKVQSKETLPSGQVQVITEYSGKDNGKKALIKNVYTIGKSDFSVRKEVKFENTEEWLLRNEYKYTR